MRTVSFKQHLGSVQLTLDFTNGSFRFRVSPLQAAVISLFNGPSPKSLTADFLAKELEISVDDVRRKGVAFWVCKGVLKEQRMLRQLGSSNYRSSALLSNADIDVLYTSVERLELKNGDDEVGLIEAAEVAAAGA